MLVKSTFFALAASVAVPGVDAFFKMPVDNPLVIERSDPLVSPGTVSGHVHTIAGGSNFSPDATYEDLRKSECTTAQAIEDKSNYWVPQLYFHWANDTFSAVPQVGYGLIYYLFRDNAKDKTKITAFPPGFKMLTGNPMDRTYTQTGNAKDAIGWNCLGSPAPTRIEGSGLPVDRDCSGNLRGEIRFPSCWDGKQNYTTDGSHVAYSAGETGPCPSTHPTRIPTLFYEINYNTHSFEKHRSQAMNTHQPFVLANGDPTGQGWHGDFMNGWPEDLLQEALETCLSPTSGSIEECPILKLRKDKCHRTPLWNEITSTGGPLKALPGCNKITTTSAAGLAQMKSCSAKSPAKLASKPTVYMGNAPPPGTVMLKGVPTTPASASGYKYQGCYKDGQGTRTFAKQLTTSAKTIAACFDAAKKAGWSYAGLEYGGECWVSKCKPTSTKLIDGKCDMVCSDNPLNYCGGAGAMGVYKLT
ncbi:hypothetical protein JCM11641_001633 [Rhodosporidiobolus odoratus]